MGGRRRDSSMGDTSTPLTVRPFSDRVVPEGSNPIETLAWVREHYPDHPAVPQLVQVARAYQTAKTAGRIVEETYRCLVCRDSGVEEFTAGEVTTAGQRSPYRPGHRVNAREVRVARPCPGVGGNGCAWLAHVDGQRKGGSSRSFE